MSKIIRTIYDDARKRRVVIYQNENGQFSFAVEYFSEDEYEMCWLPISRNISFFCSLEVALREVYSRVEWLVDM